MLMSPGNTVHPTQFVPNFVTGQLFMNKADYTTFFKPAVVEGIHGIHMLPLTPASPYIRSKAFVAADWREKLRGIVDSVQFGWRGILMANLAIADPYSAWKFFAVGFDRVSLVRGEVWLGILCLLREWQGECLRARCLC